MNYEISKVIKKNITDNWHLFHLVYFACPSCKFTCISLCVFGSSPVGFEVGMWDLIVLVPDHCLSFYFLLLRD